MRRLLTFLIVIAFATNVEGGAKPEWKPLAPGLDITTLQAVHPAPQGESKITVLRIDPAQWELEFAGLSQTGGAKSLSAREWCANKFTAAINAGMFQQDGKTHVGYLSFGDHVNSKRVTNYQSVAAFNPRHDGLPRFHIFDLEENRVTIPEILKDYNSVVQNLRLIQRPGLNKWRQDNRRWSEATLGEDEAGRILFIFTRSPFSMYELNQELLAAHIGLVAAQHLEGGPEAQLYVHAGKTELEMFGSFETGFLQNDKNAIPWPIPNVLAIRPRTSSTK
jgi:Phosphodiester glycosidase